MITIKDLTKKYEDTIIFEHTDYQFPDQGLVCLLWGFWQRKKHPFEYACRI